jgi:NAD(P)-dependent dehydrogenase (short-subunit alcohol dehydrogenase family)
MTTGRLAGRVAVVTGAARGIGLAIARKYVEEGARVVLADINADEAERQAAGLGAAAIGMPLDVRDQTSIDGMVARVAADLGGIDILVNNAGRFTLAPIEDMTREQYDEVFAVNVEGLLFTLQAVARHMIVRGQGGKMINMASQSGRRGAAPIPIYCASKAAVISITQSAGLQLIKYRINVNGISPGVVDTEMWAHVDAEFARFEGLPLGEKKRAVGQTVPYGRMGVVDDLTGAAVFLASQEADYIVAQTLNVDGGNWMS